LNNKSRYRPTTSNDSVIGCTSILETKKKKKKHAMRSVPDSPTRTHVLRGGPRWTRHARNRVTTTAVPISSDVRFQHERIPRPRQRNDVVGFFSIYNLLCTGYRYSYGHTLHNDTNSPAESLSKTIAGVDFAGSGSLRFGGARLTRFQRTAAGRDYARSPYLRRNDELIIAENGFSLRAPSRNRTTFSRVRRDLSGRRSIKTDLNRPKRTDPERHLLYRALNDVWSSRYKIHLFAS